MFATPIHSTNQATDSGPQALEHEKEKEMPPSARNPSARFSDSPNARSKTVTIADGPDTHGMLNQHSSYNAAYQVGIADDKGPRRTMEDAYSFVVDFAGVRGQGFFAIFDGHAGKHAAEWCGGHFHEFLLDALRSQGTSTIPDVLNQTFHNVDLRLSKMSDESDGKIHSGCTAVTAFLRIEDGHGGQNFLPDSPARVSSPIPIASTSDDMDTRADSPDSPTDNGGKKGKKNTNGSRIINAFRDVLRSPSPASRKEASSGSTGGSGTTPRSQSPNPGPPPTPPINGTPAPVMTPPSGQPLRRVLYTANAGDARGVLCRGGKAVRLTYDHKGSDKQEAKRIMDAGGFVMSGRVNGVLAVTRSLGDSSMKDFVVGAPYTTETELGEEDEFLILACDGLWDVTEDQGAVDLVRDIDNPQEASRRLLQYAMDKYTNDNVTILVVRFRNNNPPNK